MSKRKVIGLTLFLVYLGVVTWCCFGNFEDMPKPKQFILGIPFDKIVHFLMFFPFPFLFYMAFGPDRGNSRRSMLTLSLSFLSGCLVAGATEIGQGFTSHRTADPKDLMADAVALAAATVLAVLIILLKNNKKKPIE